MFYVGEDQLLVLLFVMEAKLGDGLKAHPGGPARPFEQPDHRAIDMLSIGQDFRATGTA